MKVVKYFLEISALRYGIGVSVAILIFVSNPAVQLALFLVGPGLSDLVRRMVKLLSKYCWPFSVSFSKKLGEFGVYFGRFGAVLKKVFFMFPRRWLKNMTNGKLNIFKKQRVK